MEKINIKKAVMKRGLNSLLLQFFICSRFNHNEREYHQLEFLIQNLV